MTRIAPALAALALLLAACGDTAGERGVTGAGIGAGAGAVVGAVTGLSLVEGALIGAAAGGLTGAVTDKDTIDIGDPFWESDSSSASTEQASYTPAGDAALVRDIQFALTKLGYDPGPVDGVMGPKTRAAIRQYQTDQGLLADGNATPELVQHIRQTLG